MNPATLVGGNNTIRLSPLAQAVAANRMQDTPVAAAPGVVNPTVAPGVGVGASGGIGQPSGAPITPSTPQAAQTAPDPAVVEQVKAAAAAGDPQAQSLLNAMLIAGGVASAGVAGAYALSKIKRKPKSGFIPDDVNADPFPKGGPGPKPNIDPNRNVPALRKSQDVEAFNHPYTTSPHIEDPRVGYTQRLGQNNPTGQGLGPTKQGRETEFAYMQKRAQDTAAAMKPSNLAAARKASRMDMWDKAMRGVRSVAK